jgi:hypothetical protein
MDKLVPILMVLILLSVTVAFGGLTGILTLFGLLLAFHIGYRIAKGHWLE